MHYYYCYRVCIYSRAQSPGMYNSSSTYSIPSTTSSSSSRYQVRIQNRSRRRRPISHRPALATSPLLLIAPKVLDGLLDLRAQIRAVKGRLVHNHGLLARRNIAVASSAVPAHAVDGVRGATLLQHDADGVCEAHGVVRRVGGQQEHVALADDDVAEGRAVDDLEDHGAAVLVEPFGGLVDVVVGAGVGATDDLQVFF